MEQADLGELLAWVEGGPGVAEAGMETALRRAALAVSSLRGGDIFPDLVRQLATILQADTAFIALTEPDGCTLRMLAFYLDGGIRENFAYPMAGTPCETVVGQRYRAYSAELARSFPSDTDFARLGMESYAGYPLADTRGTALGLMSVVWRRPIPDGERVAAVLQIFAVRAAAEIESLRAEEAQRLSEASYRAIFEAAEDAILVHDWDTGLVLDVNPKACEVYGYTYEEMCGMPVERISSGVPPYTGRDGLRWLEEAKRGGKVELEWHSRHKDGSLHWDEVRLKRAVIGGPKRVLAFTRDITERREREAALRRSEARLRATVEAAFDCVVGMDSAGRVVEFNPAAERTFGYARDAVLGRPLAELIIPPRFRAAHEAGMARYLASGAGPFLGRRVEIFAQRADGSEFPVELAIGVAASREGDIFIGYLRDITERKAAEEERARLEAQLRQAQKMEAIGHLAGGIAHDFNNILTSILGYLVLADERAAELGDERLERYLEQSGEAARRARDLIRQMLTFSRGQRSERRALALPAQVRDSLRLLRATLPPAIELETALDADVPTVLANPVQVEQVLLNLCINARDAVGGAGTIRVAVRAAEIHDAECASCHGVLRGPVVELVVADSGPGIAPEVLERIFEPFFTTKEVGRGSGMGLAMVHGIVHEHGGHILVEPRPGATVFRICLAPVAGMPECGAGPDAASAVRGRQRRRLAGRVLLVEDERMVGDFVAELLAGWGLEVTLMRNAADAESWFGEDPARVDLVLTDHAMPRITGLDLAARLAARRPGLPVILYTGYGDELGGDALARSGVRAVLGKPVVPDALFAALQAALEQGAA